MNVHACTIVEFSSKHIRWNVLGDGFPVQLRHILIIEETPHDARLERVLVEPDDEFNEGAVWHSLAEPSLNGGVGNAEPPADAPTAFLACYFAQPLPSLLLVHSDTPRSWVIWYVPL